MERRTKEPLVGTVSIGGSAAAAIFAAAAAIVFVDAQAQTGWHPATQGSESVQMPGAAAGELKTPRPGQSSTPGMTGAAASDRGVARPGSTRGTRRLPDVSKRERPAMKPNAVKPDSGDAQ
jgi:hypothetical protein